MSARGDSDAIRLNMAAAVAHLGDVSQLTFRDTGPEHAGRHALSAAALVAGAGDVVLARRLDVQPAYHLAVVVDDAAQGVTEAVRGADLFGVTALHRLLIALLSLPVPDWHHHRLIRDAAGTRLAKRTDAEAIAAWRARGATPAEVRAMVGM